jgi:prepilin-type processing-associated H-X9-DG protein
VKYAEVTPKLFICKGDSGTTEFKPADEGAGDRELIDLWDFGPEPTKYCIYSYHLPFSLYALTTSSEPGMAVAADRNPFIESPAAEAKDLALFNPDGGRETMKVGNAITHQEDGQNVLFLDGHVGFEKVSFCGINDDNIYTYWDGGDIRRGGLPNLASIPGDRADSLLVHDGTGTGGGGGATPPPKGRACFTPETTVWATGQLVQIASATGQSVEQVQEHTGTFVCRDIVLETGNTISVVDAHCFMTDSGQWVAAQNLTRSLRLKTLTGTVGIKSISTRSYTGKVYNLQVKSSDQYMVGKDAVVVRDY